MMHLTITLAAALALTIGANACLVDPDTTDKLDTTQDDLSIQTSPTDNNLDPISEENTSNLEVCSKPQYNALYVQNLGIYCCEDKTCCTFSLHGFGCRLDRNCTEVRDGNDPNAYECRSSRFFQ